MISLPLAAAQGPINKLLGLPESASQHGFEIDMMLEFVHWFMLALLIGWSLFFIITLWRFRRSRSPSANYRGVRNGLSTHLEIGVVLIEAVLLVGFAFPLWANRVNDLPPGDEAVTVRAYGYQFGWYFHFPGEDGLFGRRDVRFVTDNNRVGLDPTDEAGKDDRLNTLNTLPLPVNRPVIIRVTSQDVIHNFAIHQMRIAQDAIPGMEVPMWFTPVREGTFEVICGQLCGAGHSLMRAEIEVMAEDDYEAALAALPKPLEEI